VPIAANPLAVFLTAWERAAATAPEGFDHSQAMLATADAAGRVSARVVLVRGADEAGFTFYTNYRSRKARDLDANPRAALCFYWYWLDEQVRVEGPVQRIPDEESDAYFASRPRGNQLGAWASQQSAALASREALEAEYAAIDAKYAGRDVPRPPFWGGLRLAPSHVEIWTGRPSRLHDRLLFTRVGAQWTSERLYP
jgi:pyridoxamine 5'-phosphate oxidase